MMNAQGRGMFSPQTPSLSKLVSQNLNIYENQGFSPIMQYKIQSQILKELPKTTDLSREDETMEGHLDSVNTSMTHLQQQKGHPRMVLGSLKVVYTPESMSKINNLSSLELLRKANSQQSQNSSVSWRSHELRYKEAFESDVSLMNPSGITVILEDPVFFQVTDSHEVKSECKLSLGERGSVPEVQIQASLINRNEKSMLGWFTKLSPQQKMLVLSIVDKNIVDLTLKMCEVEKMNSSVKFEITRKNRELTNYLIEEELQISIVNEQFFPENEKFQMPHNSNFLLQKVTFDFQLAQQLLESVRFTTTDLAHSQPLINNHSLDRQLNTITLIGSLLEDSLLLLDLMGIIKNGYDNQPHLYEYSKSNEQNLTQVMIYTNDASFQQGFDKKVFCLSEWICTLFQVTLKVHYEQYLSGKYPQSLFFNFKNQLIDLDNLISHRWRLIRRKTTVMEAILTKIKEQSEKEGYTLSEDAVLFKSLIQNQDSNQFIKDVSFTSIQKVGTLYFFLERSFLQVLLSAKQGIQVKTLKNQKKKSKRKQKKIEAKNWGYVRDLVLSIIDDMLRKVDQNEENKGLEESAQKIPRKRHESESLENVLSEVNFLKFDNEEDYESLNREPMSALNQSTEDLIENLSTSQLEILRSPKASQTIENIYSSEAGDSSVQYVNRDISHWEEAKDLDESTTFTGNNQEECKQEETFLQNSRFLESQEETLHNFEIIRSAQAFSKDNNFNQGMSNLNKKKKKKGKVLFNGKDFNIQETTKQNEFIQNLCSYEPSKEQNYDQNAQKGSISIDSSKPFYFKKKSKLAEEESKIQLNLEVVHSSSTNEFKQQRKSQKGPGEKPKKKNKTKHNMFKQDQGINLTQSYNMYPGYIGNTYHPYEMNNNFDLNQIDLKQLLSQAVLQQQRQHSYIDSSSCQSISTINPEQTNEGEDFDENDLLFQTLDSQVINFQKQQEKKIESVRKERDQAIKLVEKIVRATYHYTKHNISVKSYGSMTSNLAIDSSDVDLAIVGFDFKADREAMRKEMNQLFCRLHIAYSCKQNLEFIETATVPVIKLQVDLEKIAKQIEKQERHDNGFSMKRNTIDPSMQILHIDITYEDASKNCYLQKSYYRMSFGQECATYIKELCKQYSQLKPLVMVTKKLLQNSNLNQTFTGGLNSYSIVLIIAAFLKNGQVTDKVSQNLIELYHFYGYYFDAKNTLINLKYPMPFIKNETEIIQSGANLLIIDPLNEQNNPAKGAKKFWKIQEVFKQAYEFLWSVVEQNSEYLNANFIVEGAISSQEDKIQLMLDNIQNQFGNSQQF